MRWFWEEYRKESGMYCCVFGELDSGVRLWMGIGMNCGWVLGMWMGMWEFDRKGFGWMVMDMGRA